MHGYDVVSQSQTKRERFLSEKSMIKQFNSQHFIDLKVSRDH